jgi:pimeloyl-ACP methyl ester carboxylesterase
MARSPGRDTLISLEYRSPLTGGPALATLGCLLERLPVGARTRPRRETASSKRSTPLFRGVFRPGYRAALDHGLPGAFEQAVADADAFFTQEMPALHQWPFTEDDARRIQQPALAVQGTASPAIFAERQKLLLHWLPNAEPLDLPGLTHLLHAQDPAAVADGLAGFFARQPIPEPL